MTKNDALYKHTLIRLGPDAMRGVDRLLDDNHRGVAERHTVAKLITYVRSLESQLGIDIPNPEKNAPSGYLKVTQNGHQYMVPRQQ